MFQSTARWQINSYTRPKSRNFGQKGSTGFNRRHAGRSILTLLHLNEEESKAFFSFNRRHAGRSILTWKEYCEEREIAYAQVSIDGTLADQFLHWYEIPFRVTLYWKRFNRRHAGRSILTYGGDSNVKGALGEKFQSTARWQINSYCKW